MHNLAVLSGTEIHVYLLPQASISLQFVRNHPDDHLSCQVCFKTKPLLLCCCKTITQHHNIVIYFTTKVLTCQEKRPRRRARRSRWRTGRWTSWQWNSSLWQQMILFPLVKTELMSVCARVHFTIWQKDGTISHTWWKPYYTAFQIDLNNVNSSVYI